MVRISNSQWRRPGNGDANGMKASMLCNMALNMRFDSSFFQERMLTIFQPIVAVQNALPAEMVSIGTALVVFAQSFGGALFLATGETDFASSLVKALPRHAPNVSAQTVLVAGATAFRDIVPKQELAGVVQAYNDAIVNTFYLATGGAAAVFFFAWGMGWKSVKKAKKTSTPPSETVETKTKEEV